jgi:hypothetical protein
MWRLVWQRWIPGLVVSLALCWLFGFSAVTLLSAWWPALDVLLWTQLGQLGWLLLAGVLLQSRVRLRQLFGGAGLLLVLLACFWLVSAVLAPVSAVLTMPATTQTGR